MAENTHKALRDWPDDTAEIYRDLATDDRQRAGSMTGVEGLVPQMKPADLNSLLATLHTHIGLKRLNPVWAKVETFGGLFAVASGLLMMMLCTAQPPADATTSLGVGGLALFVLGGYLAMAGHRSHLYQSNNLLAAYLAGEISKLQPKV